MKRDQVRDRIAWTRTRGVSIPVVFPSLPSLRAIAMHESRTSSATVPSINRSGDDHSSY
jgi:hypothetical protein